MEKSGIVFPCSRMQATTCRRRLAVPKARRTWSPAEEAVERYGAPEIFNTDQGSGRTARIGLA